MPKIVKDNTFMSFAIATLTDNDSGAAIAVTAAEMNIWRKSDKTIITSWSTAAGTITISGAGSNVVTLGEKSATVTNEFEAGNHSYALKVTLTVGLQVLTLIVGNCEVVAYP